MFRYPLTATGLKWIWPALLITAAFVWLFNSYKLGKFRRKKQTDFSSPIRTGDNHLKKRRMLAIAACILIGIVNVWWVFSDYSRVIEINWGITLPWKARLTEIYQKDTGPSFHGDGVRYHVYSYQYEDYIDQMFAWLPTEYPTNFYITTSKAAEVWLDEADVPSEERPDYTNCCSWHESQEDNSEIIFFWDNDLKYLYILENFI